MHLMVLALDQMVTGNVDGDELSRRSDSGKHRNDATSLPSKRAWSRSTRYSTTNSTHYGTVNELTGIDGNDHCRGGATPARSKSNEN